MVKKQDKNMKYITYKFLGGFYKYLVKSQEPDLFMFARGIISIKAISRKLRSLQFLTNVFFLPIHYSDFPF